MELARRRRGALRSVQHVSRDDRARHRCPRSREG